MKVLIFRPDYDDPVYTMSDDQGNIKWIEENGQWQAQHIRIVNGRTVKRWKRVIAEFDKIQDEMQEREING